MIAPPTMDGFWIYHCLLYSPLCAVDESGVVYINRIIINQHSWRRWNQRSPDCSVQGMKHEHCRRFIVVVVVDLIFFLLFFVFYSMFKHAMVCRRCGSIETHWIGSFCRRIGFVWLRIANEFDEFASLCGMFVERGELLEGMLSAW